MKTRFPIKSIDPFKLVYGIEMYVKETSFDCDLFVYFWFLFNDFNSLFWFNKLLFDFYYCKMVF